MTKVFDVQGSWIPLQVADSKEKQPSKKTEGLSHLSSGNPKPKRLVYRDSR